jgi:hypothetical protein
MNLYPLIARLHLWFGLILGAQVFLWMASGAVMSFFHITLVRGETNSLRAPPAELATQSYANPGGPIAQTDGATSVTLKTFLGVPVYQVDSPLGSALFDAKTGEKLSPLPREKAREVATKDFVGDGDVERVELLHETPGEYRRTLPVWRVTFADDLETRIYVSPETGEILARRNAIWRVYDFFWMLHIMDYKEREDFNNPLVKTFAASGLLFSITGIYMVVALLLRGKYRLGLRRNVVRGAPNQSSPGSSRRSVERHDNQRTPDAREKPGHDAAV